MDANRHQVVHQVVARRHAVEDLADKTRLVGCRHVAVAERCLPGRARRARIGRVCHGAQPRGIAMLLKDRVMLITNVEKFAGHGTTRVALGQGATVLAHDPSFEAPSARRKYEAEFPGAHALSAVEPATLVELALKRHGHIDALVNNDAYPALRAPLSEARLEDYRAALEAMAVTPYRLVQLVAPAMRKRKSGRIVFVSSAAPLRGIANYAPYVAARAAANGLVASLAKELGRDGIR